MGRKSIIKSNRWYIDKFEGQYKTLLRLSETAVGDEKARIEDMLDYLFELMYEEEYTDYLDELSLADRIEEEVDRLAEDWFVRDIVEGISKSSSIKMKPQYISIPKITNDELFGLVYDFYKSLGDREIFKLFRGMFKKRGRYLYMDRLAEVYICPASLFIPYDRKVHIKFKRKGLISDLIDLPHEYGHGIQYLTNYNFNLLSKNSFFSEVVSTFFELLAMDYFGKIPEFSRAAKQEEIVSFNDIRYNCKRYIIETNLLEFWSNLESLGFKRKMRMLNEEYKKKVDKDDTSTIVDLLDENLPYEFIYGVSYSIAVELFINYLKDPEWGMYLLKKFMGIDLRKDGPEYYDDVLGIVTPNEHLEDYRSYIIRPKK